MHIKKYLYNWSKTGEKETKMINSLKKLINN